ncbi:MAG: AtpZ/AtpI family protein [Acidimicrobiales bacterium]
MANPAKALEGADDGVTAALELVLTPALFAFFGWLVDRWLGTTPLFILLFAGIVLAYEVWKLWYNYTERMKAIEQALPDTRGPAKADGEVGQ